jgi:hypothetical protein
VPDDVEGTGTTADVPAGEPTVEEVGEPAPSTVGVRIRGTFNTVHLERYPSSVTFDTWTRWGYAFAGKHTFRHALVDALGAPMAESETREFTLSNDRASYQHVGQWEVEVSAAGVYFLLCYTDEQITRVLPIWVQDA